MHMTDRGLMALVRHEGLVPGPYLDVKNVWTFGIGHTAAAGPPDPTTMPRGMPADLDAGPILGQARVPVLPGDTPESLAARVLEQEHRLYPAVLRRFAADDRRPVLLP
ncbi:MAG: hypothetical protein CVT84_11205 [Alphaproteobacteria bacterium HGW-Alphaproteobacteria-6]|nr:MAG: hypothetical protein CVT84_11205 [Alphaproteobacteria bacterium HGW-Alphaproteobacteria-6]